MLSDKMLKAINEQITKEFYSAYLYLSMAGYFEEQTLPGLAKWMRVQAQEESCHAMILFNYVNEQGGKIVLGAIEAPPCEFASVLDVFEKTLAHEKKVTASIYALMDTAVAERDYASRQMLDWFVTEQVEEEQNDNTIIAQLKRIKDDSNAMFLLDKDLGTRIFAVPAPLVGKI